MLFLYRPRQTWMPFRRPQAPSEQAAYNRRLQDRFDATRRVPPAAPVETPPPPARDALADLRELGALHASGALTDEEFATAKAKVLGTADDPA
jgi:hypothetical protein